MIQTLSTSSTDSEKAFCLFAFSDNVSNSLQLPFILNTSLKEKTDSASFFNEKSHTENYVTNNDSFDDRYFPLREKILNFFILDEDWDGYGAISPNFSTISDALDLLEFIKDKMLLPPKVMLSGEGIIGFYWKDNSSYAEIDIDGTHKFSFYAEDHISLTDCEEEDFSLTDFPTDLLNFISEKSSSSIWISSSSEALGNWFSSSTLIPLPLK